MKDIIMLDLVKIFENSDRYDKLVMELHMARSEFKGALDHILALKKDPKPLFRFSDVFHPITYDKRLQSRVKQEQKNVEEHLTNVARASLLTIEHLDNVMLPWLAQTTAQLFSVPDWEHDQYCTQYIHFRPQYHVASHELSEYFKEVELRSGSYVYLIESQGAFNHKCDRYLREIEFKSLNFRTTVASLRLEP